jgi:hypothetical protein
MDDDDQTGDLPLIRGDIGVVRCYLLAEEGDRTIILMEHCGETGGDASHSSMKSRPKFGSCSTDAVGEGRYRAQNASALERKPSLRSRAVSSMAIVS